MDWVWGRISHVMMLFQTHSWTIICIQIFNCCSIIVSVAFLKTKHVILHISCVKVSITSSCQWVLNEWLRKKNQAIMFLLHPLEDLRRRQDIVVFINKVDLQFICFIWSLHYCSFKFVHQQYISGREISSSVFGTTKRTSLYIILEFVFDLGKIFLAGFCELLIAIWLVGFGSNTEKAIKNLWKI